MPSPFPGVGLYKMIHTRISLQIPLIWGNLCFSIISQTFYQGISYQLGIISLLIKWPKLTSPLTQ